MTENFESAATPHLMNQYLDIIKNQLEHIVSTESVPIMEAARLAAEAVANDGIIYTFGTGHSHCVAEEVVYRAGGLVPVDAILEPSLTGNTDVAKSEFFERVEGVGSIILDHRRVTPKDLLIIISNSGRNAAPIEMALEAKLRGIPTVAITSVTYSSSTESRHSSGKRLYELADVVIDNAAVLGDAVLHLDGLELPVGPTSNINGLFIIHSIMSQAAQNLLNQGLTPPVFFSGNIDGARERNQAYIDKYWNRIRTW